MALFRDRSDGGTQLAERLRAEAGPDTVVVGLARGGVEVAAQVALALGLPLDVVAVRKVGHPYQPEYGLGAVAPGGGVYVRASDGLTEEQLNRVVAAASAKAEELDHVLHAEHPPLDIRGKVVLVVDDGLATGATMTAALRWARERGARRVVASVPVAAAQSVEAIAREADAVVAVHVLSSFGAVGFWYDRFDQLEDEDVLRLLDSVASRPGVPAVDGEVAIETAGVTLPGDLTVPADTTGVVVFAHGSGSSRHSPRNRFVASVLQEAGIGTLLFDLLTPAEELDRRNVFDIPLLAVRLQAAIDWVAAQEGVGELPIGAFGASTGAAAALQAAASVPDRVRAVVSRGGRPDLAGLALERVRAPTLLIVGGLDDMVISLNRQALALLPCEKRLEIVPGATHLFEEPGTLERAAALARDWFRSHLTLP